MDISNVTAIAGLAMEMKNVSAAQELKVAVTKQILEQQQQHAQALVDMMKQSNAVVNGHVDAYA